MPAAHLPPDEASRQRALDAHRIVDTLPDQAFDDLTLIASAICETPIALVSLLDHDRQWFKSVVGLGVRETGRELAFCGHAILGEGVLEVRDATEDPRFQDNALVLGDPHIRFYAGAPLVTSEGHSLGTLCVIDRTPRVLTAAQRNALEALARQVMAQLEQRRLLAEKERLASFPELSPNPVAEVDLQGRLLYANAAARRSVPDLVAYAADAAAFAALAGPGAWLSGAPATREVSCGDRHFAQTIMHRPDENAVRIYAHDITARREAELKLREAERRAAEAALAQQDERYRTLISSVNEVITLIDDTGTIRYESPAVAAMLGYEPEELVGRNGFELVHEDDLPALMAVFADAVGWPDARLTVQFRFLHKDGSWRDLEVVGTNLLHRPGIGHIVLSSRDVTERKRMEREAIAQREALLRNERLSALGILVAGVAHEINNPLMYIRGNVRYALETLDALEPHVAAQPSLAEDLVEARAGLLSALTGADRIGTIAKALKVVARKGGGARERMDLNEVVRDVEALVRTNVPEGVDVEFALAPSPLPILGNAAELNQVLLNLTKNAIEALPPEGGRVRVRAERVGDDGVLHVEDDGAGIPEDVKGSLFTPFLTTKPGGTGLGLSIVHGIVKEHGGEVHVESSDSGAIFRARLPLDG